MPNEPNRPVVDAARLARLREQAIAARAEYAHKPGISELLTPDEIADGAPFYFEMLACVAELKKAREAAGMTLAQVAEKSGLATETLCRLETGQVTNPTWKTLGMYAVAVGRSLMLTANQTLTPRKSASQFTREKKGTSVFIWDVTNPTRDSGALRLVITPRGPDGSHVDPSLRLERNLGRNNALTLAERVLRHCGASEELIAQVNALRNGELEEE